MESKGRVQAIKDRIRSQRQRIRKHRITFPPKGPGRVPPLIRIYKSDNDGISGYYIPDQIKPFDQSNGTDVFYKGISMEKVNLYSKSFRSTAVMIEGKEGVPTLIGGNRWSKDFCDEMKKLCVESFGIKKGTMRRAS